MFFIIVWILMLHGWITYLFDYVVSRWYKGSVKPYKPIPLSSWHNKQLNSPRRKILVLDVDETLMHADHILTTPLNANEVKYNMPYDGVMSFQDELTDILETYYIRKRPHIDYFLELVSQWYEIVIFTAATKEYADYALDFLDNGRGLFNHRFYRHDCRADEFYHANKDLTRITKDLTSIAIVDNTPDVYNWQPRNGIPIRSWYCDPKDRALLDLLPMLDKMRFATDVRLVIQDYVQQFAGSNNNNM